MLKSLLATIVVAISLALSATSANALTLRAADGTRWQLGSTPHACGPFGASYATMNTLMSVQFSWNVVQFCGPYVRIYVHNIYGQWAYSTYRIVRIR